MFYYHFLVHKHLCCASIQKHLYCYTLIYVYFFYSNVQHTSLNILNILLMFLCLFFFFAILFRVPVHILLYCTFLSMGCTATLQFHYGFFFYILYSGHKISLHSCSNTFLSIVSFLSHSTYCTLVISPLLS